MLSVFIFVRDFFSALAKLVRFLLIKISCVTYLQMLVSKISGAGKPRRNWLISQNGGSDKIS